jgi:thiol:disulfide interchange protein
VNPRGSILGLLLLAAAAAPAQRLNPVTWSLAAEPARVAPGGRLLARFTAKMEPGWHLYALSAPPPIIATTLALSPNPAIASARLYQPAAATRFDENFGVNVATYEGEAAFVFDVEIARNAPPGPLDLAASARFQTCNNKMCLPPRRIPATASVTVDPAAAAAAPAIPAGYTGFQPNATPPAAPAQSAPAGEGLGLFILAAFGVGLASLFTPCVFPMVPITVSYFLKKPGSSRARGIFDAALFSFGIVALFTTLGLAATAALGPFGVVQLGSNVWVNAFVAAVFLIFGLSLLGAFELTIPSGVLTRLSSLSQGGGALGSLLMGLTFSLTAFACVGPFVGTLLAASVSGGGVRPVAGMLSFAAGLATPFFFLALFPSYLKRMPRSGGWLERVKVVMGFLILAAMLKYLSAIDQVMQWNALTRERFLSGWIVLFALAGLYLLGLLRLPGVKPEDTVGVTRLLAGAAFLIFSISLVPGMFGARLGELDAFVPPATASPGGPAASSGGLVWMKDQYREALDRARQENKRVLVVFTGYACTNCHWMKANMFTRPEIAAVMKDFVLVELYTDGTDDASLQNQKLQETRFQTVAIPYYAILSADEKTLATFPGLTRNSEEFLAFLKRGA